MLSSKNNRTYSKKYAQEKTSILYSWNYTINHNENKNDLGLDKNKIVANINCLSMVILACIK